MGAWPNALAGRPGPREIGIDISPSDDILIDEGGAPVWPVRGAEALHALTSMAAMLGTIRLSKIAGRPGCAAPGAGAVAALASELADAARLYAHLTGRRWNGVCGASGIVAGPDLEVLFLRRDQLDWALLTALYERQECRVAPGLIYAASAPALRRQLLCRALAAVAPPRPQQIAAEGFMTLDFDAAQIGSSLLFGNRAAAFRKHAALTGGADAVTFLTHSDGVDAYVDAGSTLCPMDNAALSSSGRRPMCQITGTCFRHHLPIAEAVETGHLMSPARLRARILNWIVCSGLVPTGGPISPAWGLVEDMLDRGALGAVATTWTTAAASPATLRPLLARLYRGQSLGRAVRSLNRLRNSDIRLAILGDPGIRAFPEGAAGLSSNHPLFGTRRAAGAARVAHCEGSSTGIYLRAAQSSCPAPLRPVLATAIAALGAGSTGAARRAIIDFVTGRGTLISHDWLPAVAGSRRVSDLACANCNAQAVQRAFWFNQSGATEGRARYLVICPACGVIADAPRPGGLALRIRGRPGTVTLEGARPGSHWSARLRVGCRRDGALYLRDWPADPGGAAMRRLGLDGLDLPGPLQVSLVLMEGAELSIATVPHTLDLAPAPLPASGCAP